MFPARTLGPLARANLDGVGLTLDNHLREEVAMWHENGVMHATIIERVSKIEGALESKRRKAK